ncbi:hypothetical protein H4R34_004397 [Dimargaris verticillata]|uniref:Uncharacterized protein n=1 Tax=Dimargaris verticillata TaxID=2761393 RepID=A0A9W8B506_9FUNG|nr:hypothetical protein H4R34_004397 [Dimargaris verticillata]
MKFASIAAVIALSLATTQVEALCGGQYLGKRSRVGDCKSVGGQCCAFIPKGLDGINIRGMDNRLPCSFCYQFYVYGAE